VPNPRPQRTPIGGRPPLAVNDPSVSVHVRLPARQYDAVYQRAQHARVSMPEYVRRAIAHQVDDGEDDDT
jgi:hypothetical protein